MAAQKFKGSWAGYVFRTDRAHKNPGYYRDVVPQVDLLVMDAFNRLGGARNSSPGKGKTRGKSPKSWRKGEDKHVSASSHAGMLTPI